MTHDCVLDPDYEGAQLKLCVGWRPRFAGWGFGNVYTAVEEMAAEELKIHRGYDGPFELLPLPIDSAEFTFMVSTREDGE